MDYLSVKSRVRGKPSYIMARIGRNTKDVADSLWRRKNSRHRMCLSDLSEQKLIKFRLQNAAWSA
jgi:hypothetical protein